MSFRGNVIVDVAEHDTFHKRKCPHPNVATAGALIDVDVELTRILVGVCICSIDTGRIDDHVIVCT